MTRRRRLRVAALPRDANPYQALLYDALAVEGVDVAYVGELTPSRTLNTVLLPAEVLTLRRRGFEIVHLHWVFGFQLPGRRRLRLVGLLSEAWLRAFLLAVSASGLRLVWTAHNVLPHEPIFWDDVRARRAVVDAADLVIAHSAATLEGLDHLGIRPRASAVVPHGPFTTSAGGRATSSTDPSAPTTVAFVGTVASYKGVDDLLEAFASLRSAPARLIIAGACSDPRLAEQLQAAARDQGDRVELRLRRLSDEELDDLLMAADVLALPYREVTTSGTAVLGLAAGLPLIVPDLPGLAELPAGAVFRYETSSDLAAALERAIATPRDHLRAMGSVGQEAFATHSWTDIAATTATLFRDLVGDGATSGVVPVEHLEGSP